MTTQKQKIETWKEEQRKRKEEANSLLVENGMPNVQSSKWGRLELAIPDLTPFDKIAKIIDELKKVLKAVVALLEAIANLIIGLEDAVALIIQQIILQIKNFIEGMLDDAGLYALFVPMGKRFNTTFAGFGDLTPPTSNLFAPAPDDPPMTDEHRSFLVNANRYSGGNAGFYRQVAASLHDRGDKNRPQFLNDTDWVGGLVFMAGTSLDPFAFLDDLWRLHGTFGSLFKGTSMPKIPKPENVKAYPLVKPGKDKKLSVLLTWDTMDVPFRTLPDLGNMILVPHRRAIFAIRNNIFASTANNVVELMGTRDITASSRNGPDIWVVNERDFQITEASYVIRDLPIEDGDVYHFAVAWQVQAYNESGDWTSGAGTVLSYWDLSNMPQVIPFPILSDSTPPDWVRTPSVAELIPPLAQFIRLVAGYIEALAARLAAPGSILKDYVEFLKKEILRYEQIVTDILNQIKALLEMLRLPNALGGLYVRSFEGAGGNRFLLSDLAQSLSRGFPNAPPYHRGDEYVMGVILMAGGPKARVQASTKLLQAIFVSGSSDIENLADSLGEAIGELEAVAFGQDLNVQDEEPVLFNEALEPLTLCSPIEPTEVEFDDSMLPVKN